MSRSVRFFADTNSSIREVGPLAVFFLLPWIVVVVTSPLPYLNLLSGITLCGGFRIVGSFSTFLTNSTLLTRRLLFEPHSFFFMMLLVLSVRFLIVLDYGSEACYESY